MCDSLTVRCFAKINLCLEVLGARPDGYHEIRTVFQSIDLHDTLHLAFRGERIELLCDCSELPTGRGNLVVRAAESFAEATGRRRGIHMRLEKRIPVAAGLGGGSSDAAATLRALNKMSGGPLRRRELERIAAGLGSDVPFFLIGGTAAGSGRGETLSPMEDQPAMELALLMPDLRISAAEAYELFDLTSGTPISDSTQRWQRGDAAQSCVSWRNDLEKGVFTTHPELRSLKRRLIDSGALDAILSGSGAAIAGRFANGNAAAQAAEAFRSAGANAITCSSLTGRQYRERFIIEGCPDV